MGFSRGAQAALYSSLKRFQAMHMQTDGLEFAVYIAFYPPCNTRYLSDKGVAQKPTRIFHGSADNFNAIAPCRSYVELLRESGKDFRLIEYSGAHHVFDWSVIKASLKLPQAETTRRCQLMEISGGRIINSQPKRVFDCSDPCVERGVKLMYDEKAHSKAQRAIRTLLTASFLRWASAL